MFDSPERGIAPGQAVVAYADDIVLGGGTVVRAIK
ncbi:MAG: aminomethyltransferase beta-barrel domain-containing protein [Collinsella sp.]